MAEHADGSIIVDTEIDAQGFKAGSSELQRAIKSLNTKIQSLGPTFQKALSGNSSAISAFDAKASALERTISEIEAKMRSLGQTQVPTDDYQWLTTEIQKAENELNKLYEKQIKMEDTGVRKNSRAWQSLQYDIDLAKRKISEYKAEQAGMRANGTAFQSGASTLQYKELEAALASAKNKLAQMRAEASSTGNTLDKSGKKGNSSFSKLGATLKKSTSKLRQFTKQSNRASYSMNSFGGRVRMMIMMLKQMLVMRAFMGIVSSIGEGFKNLSQYSKQTNADLSALKSSLTQLKNSFATAFAPILTVVTPVLQTLINYLATAITYVGKFVAALTGAKTFTKATAVQEDFAASLGSTGAAAEKAKKQLAGFDELNVLSDTSSAGGGAGGTVSPSEMFEEVPIDSEILDFAGKLKEAFLNGDWEAIGALIGEKVGALFENVDLSGIGAAIGKIFKAAFDFRKGFLSALPEDLRNVLMLVETIGLGLAAWKISNKLLSAINNLVNIPATVSVGVALAITGVTIEAKGIADAIQVGLNGFNFAEIIGGGLLGTGGTALLGSSIATWITTAFEGSAVASAISTAAANIGVGTAGAVGASFGASIGGIILGLPAMFVGIYDACVNEIDWLNAALTGAGATAAGAGIGAIIGMCGGPIGAGVGALIGLAVGLVTDGIILIVQKWDVITEFLSNFFTVTVPGIWNSFVGWLQNIPSALGEFFGSLPGKISTWFSNMWQPIKDYDWAGLGNRIGTWFGNALKNAIHFVTVTIPTWFGELWDSISSAFMTFFTVTLPKFFTETLPQAFNAVVDFVKGLPEMLWNAIQTGWNWLVDIGESIVDGIWEGLQTVWQAITDFVGGFVQGFKDALGIHSPSTVFAEIGGFIIEGLLNGIKNMWSGITNFFTGAFDGLKNLISNAWENIKTGATTAWTNIKTSLSTAWTNIKTTASNTWNSLKTTVSTGWENIKTATSTKWNTIKSSLSTTWEGIKTTASTKWNNLKTTISTAWDSVKTTATTKWTNIKTSLSTAWEGIKTTASTKWTNLKSTISTAWDNIKTTASSKWESIKTTLSGKWDTIKSTASTKWTNLKSTISTKWTEIKNNASSTWDTVKSTLSSKWDSIKSTASTKWDNIKSTIKNKGWSGVGSDICSGISSGIDSGWSWLKDKVGSVASSLLDKAKSALGIHSPSRLFRDIVGLNIGYGIGEGIEASEGSVVKTVTGLADAIAAEANAGEYNIGGVVSTAEVDGALTGFSDKVANSFSTLLERLQAIADGVTFTVPAMATGTIVPYSVSASTAGGNNVTGAIEASNEELGSVIIQAVTNATTAIVAAIEDNSGTVVNLDANSIATSTIKEINRRTRAMGKSPILI